jgi:DNA-binding transcriptional ArsR family regulator
MASLHVLTEQDHHPQQRRWVQTVNAAPPPSLAPSLRRFAPLWSRYRCRLMLPLAPPLDRTLADELGILEDLDLHVFAEHIASAIVGVQYLGGLEDVLTDSDQQDRVLRKARRVSCLREELAERLFADAEGLRSNLLEALAECGSSFFEDYWEHAQFRLREASDRLVRRLAEEPLAAVFMSLGPASRFERSPTRVIYDKLQHSVVNLAARHCFVVPSLQSFPHVLVKVERRWPVVVHTPVAPTEDAQAPSLAAVKSRLSILTDSQRLALCRHLAYEDITTSELARRTGMSASQVSRHIGRLRGAGLITSSRDGRLVYHRLATDVVIRLGVDLMGALLR